MPPERTPPGDGSGDGPSLLDLMSPGVPYTSTEMAAELDCARTTAYKRLQRLTEAGRIETKKVGARGRVWWRPHDRAGESAWDGSAPDKAEYDRLVRDERQFRAVFEEAFDAILIADDDARLVEVNPAACELFGLPREELLGRTSAEFAVEGYDFERAWRDFQKSDLDRGLFPLRRADGEKRIAEFAATPNILPGRHLSVLRDVTERQEAVSERDRARERARQYRRSLAADTVIQLDIQLENDLFARLTDGTDCSVEFEGTVSMPDGGFRHYVALTGRDGTDCLGALEDSPDVETCRVVFEDGTERLLELDLSASPLGALLEAGAVCRSLSSAEGVTALVAEFGADVDLQELQNELRGSYPGASIVAKRTIDRPIVTTKQYRDSLVERLTGRQTETLRAAHHGGYFEWPRRSTAEELADTMDVSTPTWLRHLRLAEGKLVRWYFEELAA